MTERIPSVTARNKPRIKQVGFFSKVAFTRRNIFPENTISRAAAIFWYLHSFRGKTISCRIQFDRPTDLIANSEKLKYNREINNVTWNKTLKISL